VCGDSCTTRAGILDKIETYAKREACKRVPAHDRSGCLRVLDGIEQKNLPHDKELN
jgi:hypothetical protein